MVGMTPTDEHGKVIELRVEEAKRAAGITRYEQDWIELQEKMDRFGLPKTARLSLPVRDVTHMPEIANILHGLANEITALYAQNDLSDFSKLFEMFNKVRSSERRLGTLGK